MTELALALASALMVGLLGGIHCFGMCGGIVGAMGFAANATTKRPLWLLALVYNLGRIASYAVIATILSLLIRIGGTQVHFGHSVSISRIIAGVLLIAMGLSLANWWQGIVALEKVGQWLWRHLQPLGSRLLPVTTARRALALGMVWGWLPCGLVYSALALSVTRESVVEAPLMMLAFGLGTLPAVYAGSLFAQQLKLLLQRTVVRRTLPVFMMLFGVWTLWAAVFH